jgi:hypothetical protein
MATQKIYAGVSGFLKNKAGSFDWLANHARPIIGICRTKLDGTKQYFNVFANTKYGDVTVTESKTHVTIKIAKNTSKPVFSSDDSGED